MSCIPPSVCAQGSRRLLGFSLPYSVSCILSPVSCILPDAFCLRRRFPLISFLNGYYDAGCVRFESRRERNHLEARCLHQLDAEEFFVAYADGTGLLRD